MRDSTGGSPAYRRSLSIESLLEQIKQLRRQLELSLDNNSSLHDILINASQVIQKYNTKNFYVYLLIFMRMSYLIIILI